jgi:hypothetical protein
VVLCATYAEAASRSQAGWWLTVSAEWKVSIGRYIPPGSTYSCSIMFNGLVGLVLLTSLQP